MIDIMTSAIRALKTTGYPQALQKGPHARRRRACRQAGGSEK